MKSQRATEDAEVEAMSTKKYPVAETFVSPQGEGLYTGALMLFVRLAGCSVGKKISSPDERLEWSVKEGAFPAYREVCTLYDGRQFLCDTDFGTKEVLTADEILDRVPDGVERICLTGGEPLNHDLRPLLTRAWSRMLDVHIETSGTVSIRKAYPPFGFQNLIGESVQGWIWLTVSPKFPVLEEMIELASELKYLVDENFDPDKIPGGPLRNKLTYIQPINDEHRIRPDNMQRCLELQQKYRHWRISSQAHKLWNVR